MLTVLRLIRVGLDSRKKGCAKCFCCTVWGSILIAERIPLSRCLSSWAPYSSIELFSSSILSTAVSKGFFTISSIMQSHDRDGFAFTSISHGRSCESISMSNPNSSYAFGIWDVKSGRVNGRYIWIVTDRTKKITEKMRPRVWLNEHCWV